MSLVFIAPGGPGAVVLDGMDENCQSCRVNECIRRHLRIRILFFTSFIQYLAKISMGRIDSQVASIPESEPTSYSFDS